MSGIKRPAKKYGASIGIKTDPILLKRRVDHTGSGFFAIIKKDFNTVSVQKNSDLQFSIDSKHFKFSVINKVALYKQII